MVIFEEVVAICGTHSHPFTRTKSNKLWWCFNPQTRRIVDTTIQRNVRLYYDDPDIHFALDSLQTEVGIRNFLVHFFVIMFNMDVLFFAELKLQTFKLL